VLAGLIHNRIVRSIDPGFVVFHTFVESNDVSNRFADDQKYVVSTHTLVSSI
jgi:hypothetical protein